MLMSQVLLPFSRAVSLRMGHGVLMAVRNASTGRKNAGGAAAARGMLTVDSAGMEMMRWTAKGRGKTRSRRACDTRTVKQAMEAASTK
jgi:hypothetical protein